MNSDEGASTGGDTGRGEGLQVAESTSTGVTGILGDFGQGLDGEGRGVQPSFQE